MSRTRIVSIVCISNMYDFFCYPVSEGEMDKTPDTMVEKREKKGLLRRGCGRLVRVLFQCVMPCCNVGRRRRGRRDFTEEHDVVVCPSMIIL